MAAPRGDKTPYGANRNFPHPTASHCLTRVTVRIGWPVRAFLKGMIVMKRFFEVFAIALVLAGLGQARADTLHLSGIFNYPIYMDEGSNHNIAEGGGVLPGATLNGAPIAYLYCVELYRVIYVPGNYNTNPTNGGVLFGPTMATTYNVANAGEIAWLLVHIAPTVASDTIGQEALQAAIWHLIDNREKNTLI